MRRGIPLLFAALVATALSSRERLHFATLTAAQTRAGSHRWRPVTSTVDMGVVLIQNSDALRRYTRAMIACSAPSSYGVVALCDRPDKSIELTVYVLRDTVNATGVAVEAILWPPVRDEVRTRARDVRAFRAWHRVTLGRTPRAGRGLEVADRRLFPGR